MSIFSSINFKKVFILLLLFFLSIQSCKKESTKNNTILLIKLDTLNSKIVVFNGQLHKLNFEDNFNNSVLDTNKWYFRTGERILGNNLKENIQVSNGCLKILLKKETNSWIENMLGSHTRQKSSLHYTNGGIISKSNIFDTGFYLARIRMPSTKGWHNAFWTIQYSKVAENNELIKDSLPINEVDVLEYTSINDKGIHGGINQWSPIFYNPIGYVLYYSTITGNKIDVASINKEFHNYEAYVQSDRVTFFFDEIAYASIIYPDYFQDYSINPSQLILSSVAYENMLVGNVADTMFVDYVRYYK